jgi:hypothetical protein
MRRVVHGVVMVAQLRRATAVGGAAQLGHFLRRQSRAWAAAGAPRLPRAAPPGPAGKATCTSSLLGDGAQRAGRGALEFFRSRVVLLLPLIAAGLSVRPLQPARPASGRSSSSAPKQRWKYSATVCPLGLVALVEEGQAEGEADIAIEDAGVLGPGDDGARAT